MVFLNIRKSLTFVLVRIIVEVSSLITRNIPQKWLYPFAEFMGYFLSLVFFKHRKTAFKGLKSAFGDEKTSAQRRRIVRDCFASMAKSSAELLYCMHRPYFVRNNFRIVNPAVLDKALAKGKGVILVSAHLGNFPMILARLSLEGYKNSVIMRPLKEARVEDIFEAERARLDIETIYTVPRKTCVEGAIRSLRKNRILFIPLDQNFGTGGVYVDFFGRKAATAIGPVVLARRTKAVILPCFIIRQKDDTHKIFFEHPLELEKGKTDAETILTNTQKLTDIVESYIRRYPAEWSWIHRRWKSRPKES
jgi:KDO2-lipid IV(A) lauroyltransferase